MKRKKRIIMFFLVGLCLLVWLPLLLMAAASLMPEDELYWRYLSPLGMGKDRVRAALLPAYPSVQAFADPFPRLFYHVLEFLYPDFPYAFRPVSGGGACGLGFCEIYL